jgi:S-DNA-T family DNA segregation ATPase FtsK/SpoIIIE
MILRLTVTDVAGSFRQDVEVSADPDATVQSLLAVLPGQAAAHRCFAGHRELNPRDTLAGCPLVSGAVLTVGGPGAGPYVLPVGAAGAVRVVAGPDAGTVVWLPAGGHLVGRSPQAAVRLHDADVSRRHARLDVDPAGNATVTDLGSSNGSSVRTDDLGSSNGSSVRTDLGSSNGSRVGTEGADRTDETDPSAAVHLPPGTLLSLGCGLLEWVPLPARRQAGSRSRDGRLIFDRAFDPVPRITPVRLSLPEPPPPGRGITATLLAVAVPMALSAVMALALHALSMLLFALLGPVTALATQVGERRQRRARERDYAGQQEAVRRQLDQAVTVQARLRRAAAPDPLDLVLAAAGAGRGLWPRNADGDDALLLRVGTADLPADVELSGPRWPGLAEPVLPGAPITVDLRETGVLGVVGPPGATDRLLRWLLVQLAVLRSPHDLSLVVITSSDQEDLAWTGWLPQVDAADLAEVPYRIGNTPATRAARVAELRALIADRSAERARSPGAAFEADVVVVLHGVLGLRHLPGMREVLRDGPPVGVRVIGTDRHGVNEFGGVCEVDEASVRLTRRRDEHPVTGRAEGVDRATAELVARSLAPMRDRLAPAGERAGLPHRVRLLDLLGLAVPTAQSVRTGWDARPGPTTSVVLGADGAGAVAVDLAGQGPHVMLAGATGTGKSILLQTLVTALLLANRPDELNLVLVDFKGGSAFLPFERCPHVVALIRSTGRTAADVFDAAAAVRVLASLRAEVRHRESLLAPFGGEIDAYWAARAGDRRLPPLPRLVLVFDEFARVLEVSHDFLTELVTVAAKGRSLGMHLVLATQSLQGKLSAELKNNVDLRICLRQNEDADSIEVLGVPDAVSIPGRRQGRGLLLCTKDGNRRPRPFQTGYLGDPPPADHVAQVSARTVTWATLGHPRPPRPRETIGGPSDQVRALDAVALAAGQLGLAPPRRPLLPPLPADLPLEELDRWTTPGPLPPPTLVPTLVPVGVPTLVPVGVLDDPAGQAQHPIGLDLAGTQRLLIAGGPQSGRTTAARALITALAAGFPPERAHLYVIEQRPGGLAEYARLPHCGGVLSPAEPDRIRRLVTWLETEVARRRLSGGLPGGGGSADPGLVSIEADPGLVVPPWIVVVVDGWEHFENRADPMFVETGLTATLRGIITAGPPVGIHVVALGGAGLADGRLSALYSHRLLLAFPKEDVRRAHLPPGTVSPPSLPGRAVEAAGGAQVQVCRPLITAAHLIRQVTAPREPGRLPRTFPPMPVRVDVRGVSGASWPGSAWVPIGVGGDQVSAVGLDLFDDGPHLAVISGPPGSGRSTALATLAQGLRHAGIGVLAVAGPRSGLARLLPDGPEVRLVSGSTIADEQLREAAAAFGPQRYAVLVDDCEQLTVTATDQGFAEAPTLLQDIASPAALGRQALVLAGDALPVLSGQRRSLARVLGEIMTAGTRILLCPSHPAAAREHGLILEADQFCTGPPGRGYLGDERSARLIQIGHP